jgi:hypothetical protein
MSLFQGDEAGNWTLLGLAVFTGFGIVKLVVAISEWATGERRYPWRR